MVVEEEEEEENLMDTQDQGDVLEAGGEDMVERLLKLLLRVSVQFNTGIINLFSYRC